MTPTTNTFIAGAAATAALVTAVAGAVAKHYDVGDLAFLWDIAAMGFIVVFLCTFGMGTK